MIRVKIGLKGGRPRTADTLDANLERYLGIDMALLPQIVATLNQTLEDLEIEYGAKEADDASDVS